VLGLASHLMEDLLLQRRGIRGQHAALGGRDLRERGGGNQPVHFHHLGLADDLGLLDELSFPDHLGDHLRRAGRQQRGAAGNAGEPDELTP
jgi:hypothetical protein